jgi:glycosyltransferase involved in cell wall biosynthesis
VRAAYIAATRFALRRATQVVTVSEATRRAVERRYSVRIDPSNVVPNAIDAGRWVHPGAGAIGRAREELRLPERYVLHVGARRPHKNQATLVRALARIAHDEPDLHLVLLGSPDRRFHDPVPDLVQRSRLGDRVHHLRAVPEDLIPSVYADAAVFAYPSLVEGFGIPLLESMAAGVPVIASMTPAVAEVAGDGAILLPPLDDAAFADAIRTVLVDERLRASLRERGRGRVERYRWDASAAALLDVLGRAASTVSRRRGSPIH